MINHGLYEAANDTLVPPLPGPTASAPLSTPPARLLMATPARTPIAPPMIPNNPDSIMKRLSTCLSFAPMAFIIPISRVRSRTEVNMVFITPIAPTRSEIAAIAVRVIWMLAMADFICSLISSAVIV